MFLLCAPDRAIQGERSPFNGSSREDSWRSDHGIADVLEYNLDGIGGLPQHTRAIRHSLVSHRTTPTSVRGFTIDDVNALQVTGDLRLTAVTMKALRADVALHSPAEVPAVRRGVALLNMTILELLLSLEAAGWWRPQRLRENVVELGMFGAVCPNGYVDVAPRGGSS